MTENDLRYSSLEAPEVGEQLDFPVGDILVRAVWLGVVSNGRELGAALRLAAELEREAVATWLAGVANEVTE